jgi:hypothetical protein
MGDGNQSIKLLRVVRSVFGCQKKTLKTQKTQRHRQSISQDKLCHTRWYQLGYILRNHKKATTSDTSFQIENRTSRIYLHDF